MATHHASASPPLRRVVRAWPALALAAAVLGGHAWLVTWLAPAPPRAGMARPVLVLVQMRSLPAADAPMAAPMPVSLPVPTRAAAPTNTAARRPAAHGAALAPGATPLVDAPPAPVPAAAPPDASRDPPPAGGADTADGEPPPLYPTLLPPPVQLRYALHYNDRAGEALLTWQHDGTAYRLTLDGRNAVGQPLVDQASSGALDADGLAPERFTDRRGAGRLRAANFRRDIARIGYSGPTHQHPAWPGAQDRLSWMAQLAAILGAVETVPGELRLFVADAQGNAGLWQLQRQPETSGPTPWGVQPLQHWQREPLRPEGLRIDVWLAAQPGASPSGAWPLRLRFAVPRSGDVFELNLLAAP